MMSLWWLEELPLKYASTRMKEVLIATYVGFLKNRTAAEIGEELLQ